jgi:pimeloyl-ACP methyl ester carboxylesterase
MVVAQGGQVALVGVAIGVLAAVGLTRFLASLLFGVQAIDASTFMGMASVMLAVALVASYASFLASPTSAMRGRTPPGLPKCGTTRWAARLTSDRGTTGYAMADGAGACSRTLNPDPLDVRPQGPPGLLDERSSLDVVSTGPTSIPAADAGWMPRAGHAAAPPRPRETTMSVRPALVAAILVVAACSDTSVLPSDPVPTAAVVPTVIDGRAGPGAMYRLVRPENWNGGLVLYARGYVSTDEPVALPAEADLIAGLLTAQGFAVAYSSFSENGWVVKDGAQRTHQLVGLFTSQFGRPTRVWIGGASMGGLIAIKLAEKFPSTYAGTLAACAAAAGLPRLFDYHAHARALFDFFYPGVLPGNAAFLPAGTDITTGIVLPAFAAMAADPGPAAAMAVIDQTPFPGSSAAEVGESIVTALAGNATSLAELKSLTNGKPYFDNRETLYSSALLPPPLLAAINAGIDRFAADPAAQQSLAHDYEPTGDLQTPMLMLSNAADPVMPGFNQASYLAAVLENGAPDLLVLRTVALFGHCIFTPQELATAFNDLVLWTEFGIKPAS